MDSIIESLNKENIIGSVIETGLGADNNFASVSEEVNSSEAAINPILPTEAASAKPGLTGPESSAAPENIPSEGLAETQPESPPAIDGPASSAPVPPGGALGSTLDRPPNAPLTDFQSIPTGEGRARADFLPPSSRADGLFHSPVLGAMLDINGRLNPLINQSLARLEDIADDLLFDLGPARNDGPDQAAADWPETAGFTRPPESRYRPRYMAAEYKNLGFDCLDNLIRPDDSQGYSVARQLCARALTESWADLEQSREGRPMAAVWHLAEALARQLDLWLKHERSGPEHPGAEAPVPEDDSGFNFFGHIISQYLKLGFLPDSTSADPPSHRYNEGIFLRGFLDRMPGAEEKRRFLSRLEELYPQRFQEINRDMHLDAAQMQELYGLKAGGLISADWSLDRQLEIFQALSSQGGPAYALAKWNRLADDPAALPLISLMAQAKPEKVKGLAELWLASREAHQWAESEPEFYKRASAQLADIPAAKISLEMEERLGPDPFGSSIIKMYLANMKANYDSHDPLATDWNTCYQGRAHQLTEALNSTYTLLDSPDIVGFVLSHNEYSAEILEKGASWLGGNKQGFRLYCQPDRELVQALAPTGRALTKGGRPMEYEIADIAQVGRAVLALEEARAALASPHLDRLGGQAEKEALVREALAGLDRVTGEVEAKFGLQRGSEYARYLADEGREYSERQRQTAQDQLEFDSRALDHSLKAAGRPGFEETRPAITAAAMATGADGALMLAAAPRGHEAGGRGLFGLSDELNGQLGIDPDASLETQAGQWQTAYKRMLYTYLSPELALLAMRQGRATADQAWQDLKKKHPTATLLQHMPVTSELIGRADDYRRADPGLDQRPESPERIQRFEDLAQYIPLPQTFGAMAQKGLSDTGRLFDKANDPRASRREELMTPALAGDSSARFRYQTLTYLAARAEGYMVLPEDFGDFEELPRWSIIEKDQWNRQDENLETRIARAKDGLAKSLARLVVPVVADPFNAYVPAAKAGVWAFGLAKGARTLGGAAWRGAVNLGGRLKQAGASSARWRPGTWDKMSPPVKGRMFLEKFDPLPEALQHKFLSEKYDLLPGHLRKELLPGAPADPSPAATEALMARRLAGLSPGERELWLTKFFEHLPGSELARFNYIDDLALVLKPGEAREFYSLLSPSARQDLMTGLYHRLPPEAQKEALVNAFEALPPEAKKSFLSGAPSEITLAEWENHLYSHVNSMFDRQTWLKKNLVSWSEADQAAWVQKHFSSLPEEQRRLLVHAGLDKNLAANAAENGDELAQWILANRDRKPARQADDITNQAGQGQVSRTDAQVRSGSSSAKRAEGGAGEGAGSRKGEETGFGSGKKGQSGQEPKSVNEFEAPINQNASGDEMALSKKEKPSPDKSEPLDLTDYRSNAEMEALHQQLLGIKPTENDFLYKPLKEKITKSESAIEFFAKNLELEMGIITTPVEISPGIWRLRVDQIPAAPSVSELKSEIQKLYKALQNGEDYKISFGYIGPEEAAKIRVLTGIETLLCEREFSTRGIEHAFRRHGGETSKGQKSITLNDLERYSEILNDPHWIEAGRHPGGVIYSRRYPDGTIYAVEKQLKFKKMRFKTLWKKEIGGIMVPILAVDLTGGE